MSTAETSTYLLALAWLILAASTSAQPQLPPELMRLNLALPCAMTPIERKDLEADYREIVERWSHRDSSAVDDLDALGRRLVDDAAGFEVTDQALTERLRVWKNRTLIPGIHCLKTVEDDLLKDLIVAEPESRAPMWALYFNLYRHQTHDPESSRRWLSDQTQQRLDWLVDLGRASGTGHDSDRSVNALMTMALADEMQSSPFYPLIEQAQARFEEAASLAPESFAARYWAGTLAEILGDYKKAMSQLSRLDERHPSDPEVELRLALCRARTGKRKAARQDLAQLVETPAADWLVIVAYEELARLQERDSPAVARQTLLKAVDRFPDEPELRLQLVSNLVLDGAWTAIDGLVPELERESFAEDQASPRFQYDGLRRDELEADLSRFGRQIDGQFPALSQALARAPRE